MSKINDLIKLCKNGVYITVNEHRDVFKTVLDYLDNESLGDITKLENQVICVHFYPDSPVGFYRIYHHDIDEAINAALKCFPNAAAKTTRKVRSSILAAIRHVHGTMRNQMKMLKHELPGVNRLVLVETASGIRFAARLKLIGNNLPWPYWEIAGVVNHEHMRRESHFDWWDYWPERATASGRAAVVWHAREKP